MARQCSASHCSVADPEIQGLCEEMKWEVCHPVITRDETGPCLCHCSCLAFGTVVQSGDGLFKAIETYVVGDQVMASGASLEWNAMPVVFSGGTSGVSRQKGAVVVLYGDTAIVVTSDHLFFMRDRTLKRADRLAPGDTLVSPQGEPVPVSAVHIGEYLTGFHHIATSKEPPGPELEGHLINSNGIVSADYTVQLFARQDEVATFSYAEHETLPVVGSSEYIAEYGRACLEAPNLSAGFQRKPVFEVGVINAGDIAGSIFIPAEATVAQVPPDACQFISDDLASAKAREPKRAFNDPEARGWVDSLIEHHGHFYPDVIYHNDWADDTVNAFAWVDNGVRHVSLKGGLIRHMSIGLESIALVLAHELSHHYGGPPTFPGGLSCEGQADYRGVRSIMRRVWFAEHYITMSDAGIQQMANFFGVPNSPTAPGGSSGCSHPPGACRIATYHAAVNLIGKPNCAS